MKERVSHGTNRKKASEWNEEVCNEWLEKLEWLNANGYLNDAAGLWNLDESAFTLAEMWRRVLAVRGTSKVTSYIDADPKERLTVLAAGNAAGFMLPPLVLFDGKVQLLDRLDGTDDKCVVGVNASGWMDCPNFTAYVREFLLPNMTTHKVNT